MFPKTSLSKSYQNVWHQLFLRFLFFCPAPRHVARDDLRMLRRTWNVRPWADSFGKLRCCESLRSFRCCVATQCSAAHCVYQTGSTRALTYSQTFDGHPSPPVGSDIRHRRCDGSVMTQGDVYRIALRRSQGFPQLAPHFRG